MPGGGSADARVSLKTEAEGKADGVDPKATAEAVWLLRVRRLLDEQTVTRLRDLIDKAKSGAAPAPLPDTRTEAELEAAFLQFRNWIHEWREVARATFARRDYLIMLGLASRRARKPIQTGVPSGVDDDDNDDDDDDE